MLNWIDRDKDKARHHSPKTAAETEKRPGARDNSFKTFAVVFGGQRVKIAIFLLNLVSIGCLAWLGSIYLENIKYSLPLAILLVIDICLLFFSRPDSARKQLIIFVTLSIFLTLSLMCMVAYVVTLAKY